MSDFLLELLKNVFRWIFRGLLEKENRNRKQNLDSEHSPLNPLGLKRFFLILPFQQIGS